MDSFYFSSAKTRAMSSTQLLAPFTSLPVLWSLYTFRYTSQQGTDANWIFKYKKSLLVFLGEIFAQIKKECNWYHEGTLMSWPLLTLFLLTFHKMYVWSNNKMICRNSMSQSLFLKSHVQTRMDFWQKSNALNSSHGFHFRAFNSKYLLFEF